MARRRLLAVGGSACVLVTIMGARPAAAGGPSVGTPNLLPVLRQAGCMVLLQECAAAGTPVGSHGGAVQPSPSVYIVYWGWNGNDPSGQAPYQEAFFNGIGGSAWNATVTQYCQGAITPVYEPTDLGANPGGISGPHSQGVALGSSCPAGATFAGNPTGVLHGTWSDDVNPVPLHPGDADIQAEATRAAAFFGNVTAASNQSAQYVIDTPQGNSSLGFVNGDWCAYHGAATTAYGDVFYTDFPYITDAGASCGENLVNPGSAGVLDGVSITAGHEFAETETDPAPFTGWFDTTDQEIGDKCAWIWKGPGAVHDITLDTGTFAVQSLWSNAANAGAGGCVG